MSMFQLGSGALYRRDNIVKWGILAFQAGSINIIGLLAGHRFVSHVTGYATTAALEFSNGRWLHSLGMLSVPLFFLLGALLSGFLIDVQIAKKKRPSYSTVLFLIFFLLLIALIGSLHGDFGSYGIDFSFNEHYPLLVLLSLTCGLQNAMITTASGSVIRTTHLTGITTDLGVGMARMISKTTEGGYHSSEDRRREHAAFWMRLGIILSFVTGSFLTATAALRFEYWSLAIPTASALVLFALVGIQSAAAQRKA